MPLCLFDLAKDIDDLLAKSAVELRQNLYTPKVELEQRNILLYRLN